MLDLDGAKFPLTALYPTRDQLKQETRDKISREELDIGVPIVPITVECLKIGEGGELEKHSITTEGRAYSMQKILDKLLHQHLSLGLHRNHFNAADDID